MNFNISVSDMSEDWDRVDFIFNGGVVRFEYFELFGKDEPNKLINLAEDLECIANKIKKYATEGDA